MASLALCILCAFVLPDLASSTTGTKTKTTITRTTTTVVTSAPGSSTASGDCVGNDSRCSGSSQTKCKSLGREGADCQWKAHTPSSSPSPAKKTSPSPAKKTSPSPAKKTATKTTKTATTTTIKAASCSSATTSAPGSSTASGECVGNDSRCSGSSQTKCKSLGREGADCQWEAHTGPANGVESKGKCSGNDSRCSGSRQATCHRLSTQGSDCRWESSMWASGPSGRCLGNDSRCGGSLEAGCKSLAEEGADCKWRGAFSVSGSMKLAVSNVDSFVKSCEAKVAVGQGIANLTGVPAEYIDIDLSPDFEQRRLRARELGKAVALTVTYAISVDGAAPASVTRTATDVERVLMAANADVIRSTISAGVRRAMSSDPAFSIVGVKEVKEPSVVLKSASGMSTSTTKIAAKQTTGSTTRNLMMSSTKSSTIGAKPSPTTGATTSPTTGATISSSTPATWLETSGSRKLSGCCMCFLTSLCVMIAFSPL